MNESLSGSRRTTRTERARWLLGIASGLREHSAGLVALAHTETSLPLARLESELGRTVFQLEHLAAGLRDGAFLPDVADVPSSHPAGPQAAIVRTWEPLGHVLVFAAGNFPFAFSVAGNDVAAALAAGCTVTVKAHPGHPELSRATYAVVASALEAGGAPTGSFDYVESDQDALALVREAPLGAVAFTGSQRVGRLLFDACAARSHPVPFYGELSSINPVIITTRAVDQRAEALADGLIGSFTSGAGQFCTKPGLVFVPAGSQFARLVADRLDDTPQTMLEPRLAQAFRDHVQQLAESSAGSLLGPDSVASDQLDPGTDSASVTPVVFATSARKLVESSDLLTQECFGPLTVIVEYVDGAELSRCLDVVDGQLTTTVQAGDAERTPTLRAVMDRIGRGAGRVVWNGWPTGVGISRAMTHGGPYPSATGPWTAIGLDSILRFLRPVTYQGVPADLVPSWSIEM